MGNYSHISGFCDNTKLPSSVGKMEQSVIILSYFYKEIRKIYKMRKFFLGIYEKSLLHSLSITYAQSDVQMCRDLSCVSFSLLLLIFV